MSRLDADQAADVLQELFPSLPRSLLLDVLHAHDNSIDAAAASLLQLTAEDERASTTQQVSPAARAQAAAPAAAPRRTRGAHGSWGDLGLAGDLQQKLQLAPRFTRGPGSEAAPSVSARDFPAGLPAGPAQLQQQPSGRPAGRSAGGQPWSAGSAAANAGKAASTWSSQSAAAFNVSKLAPAAPAAPPPWQQPAGAAAAEQQLQELWQQEAAQELGQLHPGVDPELVAMVLSGVGFDLDTAGAILADMVAPSGRGGTRHRSPPADRGSASCADSGTAAGNSGRDGGWSSEDDSEEEGWGEAGLEDGDFVLPGFAPGPKPQAPAAAKRPAEATVTAAAGGAKGAGAVRQLGQKPPAAPEPSLLELRPPPPPLPLTVATPAPGVAGPQPDLYFMHRAEALRLTRDWQKAVKKAAAAYGSGRKAQAAALAAQAQQLRQQSLAAHEAAATRIEAELNAGGSLFELDLHGLHASEAVAALERRLSLLQSVLQDATLQPQGGQKPPLSAAGGRGQSNDAAVVSAPASNVLPANGRWELRVVVGRGAHSSGGEATIPRAVESRLLALGYKFNQRTGALDVQLRRPFGGQRGVAGD